MLDLAARDGLQILLPTCGLSDYSGLGSHEIRLHADHFSAALPVRKSATFNVVGIAFSCSLA